MTNDPGNSQKLRIETIRNRIMVGHALCAIAESHLHAQMRQEAHDLLLRIREENAKINHLLSEVQPISRSEKSELAEMLLELRERTLKIEAMARPKE